MELNKGYKKTDIGVLPLDWDCEKIGSFTNVKAGGTPSTNVKEYWGGSIRWMNSGELNLKIVSEVENRITELGLNESATNLFPKHCVLIGLAGQGKTRGTAAVNVVELCTNQSIAAIFPCEKVDYLYLYYNLDSRYNELRGMSTGDGGRGGLNLKIIKAIYIPIPEKKEQLLISEALSDIDKLLKGLQKVIAKKRNIKQGAMQKLLSPKEGWEHKTLGEIGAITGAGVDKLINEDEVPVRLVNYMDVFRRDFIYSNELNHWVSAPQSKIQKCAVKKGDIFFTPSSEMRFDIAISAIAMEDIPDAAYSYHLVRLRLFDDWDLNFRTYIFKTKYFLGQAEQVCEGSGKRYVITLPKFRSLKIYYPPTKKEQNEISTILSDMDAEITALESKLEKYKKVKLGMMQNLLTGKIRVI